MNWSLEVKTLTACLENTQEDSEDAHDLPAGHEAKSLFRSMLDKAPRGIRGLVLERTIMTAPQARQMPARKFRGPIVRINTTAGAWKIV